MYLRSLIIEGFKSFPDRTVINFTSGITAIVGPNGSGKSNIVDAIRWVLGEQSSKTLRGSKMEDVIFNGTSSRKPTGFAEVTLIMDNADKALDIDFTEVSVTRRLYRSGESEYAVNGKPSRLRDIVELFMNTGVGKDGYSVIGQGKIADVLSSKSEDRRQIFEEAAGISKYRYRKIETERKLAATNDNLLRINDILSELTERIGPLEKQSEKAKKYLAFRDERKQLQINVWLDSVDKTNEVKNDIDTKLHIAKTDLEVVNKTFESDENEIDSLTELASSKNAEIDLLNREIREIEEVASQLTSQRAVTVNDIEHAKELIQRIEEQVNEGQGRFKKFDEDIASKNAEKKELIARLEFVNNELESFIKKNEEQIKEQTGVNDSIDSLRAKMTVKTGELTDAKILLASLSAKTDVAGKTEEIDISVEKKNDELKAIINDMKDADDEFERASDALSSNKNIIEGYNRKLQAKEEQKKEVEKQLASINSSIIEKTHKKNLLSQMEAQLDGFANSVRTVMQEASRGILKNIVGPISSLIKIEDKYALAVETALGGNIQNIVVENESDAKAAIMLLKNENKGRATFLPLTSVKYTPFDAKDAKNANGYVGIANQLVSFDKRYEAIFGNLLGRTVVVETIDNAIELAKKTGYRFRIVTLDGQQVNAGGSFTGGSQIKGAGVLSRKNEIKQLEKELIDLEKKSKELEEKLEAVSGECAEIVAVMDGAEAEFDTAKEKMLRAEGVLNQYKALLNALNASIDELTEEKDRIYRESSQAKLRIKELEKQIETFETEISAMESEYAKLSDGQSETSKLREKLASDISEKKYLVASLEKDIELADLAIAQIKQSKLDYETELSSHGNEIKAVEAKIAEYEAMLVQLDDQSNAYKNEVNDKHSLIKVAENARNEAEKKVIELRKNSKDLISKKENLIKEIERFEARKQSIDTEYDNIISSLWEEYELTLNEAYEIRTECDDVKAAAKRITELKQKMRALGDVNLGAIDEYIQVKERYDFLSKQVEDLEKSKNELQNLIGELTAEMKKIFSEQFKVINENFSKVFTELFGGGSAKLELTDPSDILGSGIEIIVSPPGKIIKNLSALSGGEQAFTAVSLYFAIMAVRPAPFCILDEIDAPLDDVNVARLANYLVNLSKTSQFITITHKRGTMEKADILYGVTMQESGVTKLLTINVSEVEKKFAKIIS